MEENKWLQVYISVAEIQGEMAKEGIGKDNTNKQQGWKFRGIDDVYNALAPKLAKHKVVIIPTSIARTYTERKSTSGSALFSVTERMAYDVVSAIDGSRFTMVMDGEAMDSGDKATSKAASIAYKYACFQLFCIPTEGDNDPDASSHSVMAENREPVKTAAATAKVDPKAPVQVHTLIDKLSEVKPTKSDKFFSLVFPNGMKISCGMADAIIARKALESDHKVSVEWELENGYKKCVSLTEVLPMEEVNF